MTSLDWSQRMIREFAFRVRRVNTSGEDLPPLSVTKDSGIVLQSSKYNKRIATDPHKYLIAEKGEFVFDPMSLYYGAIGRQDVAPRGLVSPDYVVFGVDDTVDPVFLHYLLRAPSQRAVYEANAEGGNTFGKRRRVYWSVFEELTLRMPPLSSQRRIANILSSSDETISTAVAVIERLDTFQRALMLELVTRGIPGRHDVFVPLNDEWRLGRLGVDQMPASWQLVRLTEVARLESGHTPSRRHPEYWDGNIPWISLHDGKRLDVPEIGETTHTISPLGVENSSARLLPAGTVVFSRTATIGNCSIMAREMTTSQDYANYVCGERLHNRFLLHLFRNMNEEWNRLKAGSSPTNKTIYMPIFERLQILLPPFEEQVEIARIGDAIAARLAAEKSKLDHLLVLKSALISDLVAGQTVTRMEESAEAVA